MRVAATAAAVCTSVLALAGPARADFTVNDTTDMADPLPTNGLCEWEPGNPDTCSLRAAIQESNNTVALDEIDFIPGLGTHTLTNTLPTTTEPTVIDGTGSGSGAGNTIIDGNDTFRIFLVNGDPATFRDLRIQDGGIVNPGGSGGAGILTSNDTTLTNVAVVSNQITGTGNGSGAGIYAQTPGTSLTLTNSTVTDNAINVTSASAGFGGGISSLAFLALTGSTVSNNSAEGTAGASGGGIQADVGFAITGSTIGASNFTSANGRGGGLGDGVNPAPRSITNSTFSGNTAGIEGGGGAYLSGPTTITSSTFAFNSDTDLGGGKGTDIQAAGAGTTATLRDTILAGFDTNKCFESGGASIESAVPGHNLDMGTSCGFGTANGNLQNADPMLGGLSSPPVPATHPLMPGSAAIDAGSVLGPAADERGVSRPQGPRCDIGAYELDAAGDAPSCAGFPALVPPAVPTPAATPTPKKKCKKGRKLKKGKCVKKKRKKK